MDKQYYPVEIEEKWSKIWSEKVLSNKDSDASFSQVIPPPNVTGTLHMGHSFQYAIMDFYTRYHHMSGKDAHWQVGADHAGIATQMVVENNLAKKDVTRKELGREKFLEEVWSWKDYSEEKIISQIKRLGCSVDWNKYRFTLDDGCNDAVIKAFVELHRRNKIYRGYRLVNWDPSLKTAVSDLEVVRQEKDGLLWHIKYPIENTEDFLIVATTRPETMFGDMAVAVNPNDDRYKDFVGKNVVLPFVGRKIPVLADEYVDMEFGTGCLKITPGHDFNDYEIGKKYALHEVDGQVKTSNTASDFEPINIFNEDACSNENVPEPFSDLDRFKVRKAVLEKLKELNQKWNDIEFSRYWKNHGIDEITARTGIHTGSVIAGNIGSDRMLQYSTIGDTVNVASRLEQKNKDFDTDILFSQKIYTSLTKDLYDKANYEGEVSLKGRDTMTRTYSI